MKELGSCEYMATLNSVFKALGRPPKNHGEKQQDPTVVEVLSEVLVIQVVINEFIKDITCSGKLDTTQLL